MSRSLNRIMLIGNCGNPPEVRTTQSGSKVAQFSVATSRSWNDQAGNKQEKTEWHRCVAWNAGAYKLADVVESYLGKGDKVYVEGSIEYRSWEDEAGVKRTATEIKVRELLLLGDKRRASDSGDAPSRGAPSKRATSSAKKPAAADDFSDFPGALEDDDDDLPFD